MRTIKALIGEFWNLPRNILSWSVTLAIYTVMVPLTLFVLVSPESVLIGGHLRGLMGCLNLALITPLYRRRKAIHRLIRQKNRSLKELYE